MQHIESMYLAVRESTWLPQWSFDFWIIPYLLGRGITTSEFKTFMQSASELLALEIGKVTPSEKAIRQRRSLDAMVETARRWTVDEIPARSEPVAS
jgi:hypothetical protein